MIIAILDTNVLVQAAIGSPTAASARAVDRLRTGAYQCAFSPATLTEVLDVLAVPHIRARLGWSDDQILEFTIFLQAQAVVVTPEKLVSASITRDVTDVKFLALAAETGAAYLVTNDRRHLLRLGQYQKTRIVTPAQFLKELR